MRRFCFRTTLIALSLGLLGCSSFRETLPARSATEQVLISTAGDRAVTDLETRWAIGKSVLIATENLDAYDQKYLVQRLRQAVLDAGAILVSERDRADVVLEVASGGLSVDSGQFLLGIPTMEVPIPFAGSVTLPEIALFKQVSVVGKAKLLCTAIDADEGHLFAATPVTYGRARRRFWWVLLLGPFEGGDMPKALR